MAIQLYNTGLSSSGPNIGTQMLRTAGAVFYVDSVNGSDSNAGTSRKKPKATVFGASGAYSVATTASSDVIFCEKTHRETITSAFTASKADVIMVSDGTYGDRAVLTFGVPISVGMTLTGTNQKLVNFTFAASTEATMAAKVVITTGHGSEIYGCYFNVGASDISDQILINGADHCLIRSCSMVVGAAASSGTTQTGITVTGAAIGNRFWDLVFDGGSYGWTQDAFSLDDSTADGFEILSPTLSNYSFINISGSGANGYILNETVDATSGVKWTD